MGCGAAAGQPLRGPRPQGHRRGRGRVGVLGGVGGAGGGGSGGSGGSGGGADGARREGIGGECVAQVDG